MKIYDHYMHVWIFMKKKCIKETYTHTSQEHGLIGHGWLSG